jgi:hypothetical protein
MPYGLRPPPAGIGNRHMQAEHRVSPRATALNFRDVCPSLN